MDEPIKINASKLLKGMRDLSGEAYRVHQELRRALREEPLDWEKINGLRREYVGYMHMIAPYLKEPWSGGLEGCVELTDPEDSRSAEKRRRT
jgi:hypothetical protein